MRPKVEVAFRRKVRAVWLDHGMALAAQNLPWKDAKPALAEIVAVENSGVETIRKVLEHVRRIWFEPPDDSEGLRSAALCLLREHDSADTRLLLNWGMAIAAYPFVGSVAGTLGRLLKLQNEAARSDIQRRLREQFGDRDFVNRITRYNVSSFLDWGVLAVPKAEGIYVKGRQVRNASAAQLAWIAEAILISCQQTQMAVRQLSSHPSLFPLRPATFDASVLCANPRLHVLRQSLSEEYVLRN